MTSISITPVTDLCLASGMDEYLSKPLRTPDLFSAIARVTSSHALAAGGHRAKSLPSPLTAGSLLPACGGAGGVDEQM